MAIAISSCGGVKENTNTLGSSDKTHQLAIENHLNIQFVFSKAASKVVDLEAFEKVLKRKAFNYYHLMLEPEIIIDHSTKQSDKCFHKGRSITSELEHSGLDFINCYFPLKKKDILVTIDLEKGDPPMFFMSYVNRKGANVISDIMLKKGHTNRRMASDAAFRINELAPYSHTQRF
ncbi:MAG: hypothetical protein KAH77_02920 [Thiomargarita sp.]|nr:hypothetical protein [Thiomargarita sp.]